MTPVYSLLSCMTTHFVTTLCADNSAADVTGAVPVGFKVAARHVDLSAMMHQMNRLSAAGRAR
jgi:hypothetical protein